MELRESPLALEPTVVAGRYAVGERLGAGGMGDVFRARDLVSGRSVAFKQLRLSEAGPMRRRFEALFEREYHTLVRLRHPRIIEVYDYGATREGPYYTMELLDGADLLASAPLPYRQVCSHLRDIASSLALLHAHRLVHRDISPNNVRLTRDGRAKLIDFGALTAFGPSNETAGTPPCTAPEVMRKMPLDQRTDLYALGVVGYWALTRRLPYVAKRFSDLPAAWQTPPPPPSALQPEVPPELDALIAWLINLEPLARPINAASVIDRLTAIGQLEPEDHEHAAESYLSSSRMVGRRNEQEWASRRIARALEGKGTQVVIEGAAGMGKTRLLQEIGLQAQLKGLLVAKADAQAAPLSFGVACQLALALLDSAPGLAERGARPSASLLAHLSDALRARLGNPELAELSIDPGERRMRFQTALHDWFRGVARERPLLIAVDNVHAADSNSVAFLTALGRQAEKSHIIVLVTHPDVLKSIGPGHFKALYGGLLYLMAGIEVFRGFGAAELALADDMDELGVQSWAMAADQVRLLHHAYRGESERVRYYRERAELVAVQGGTTWQTETIWPALLIHADLLTGDAIALRRSAGELARRARNVPSLAPHVLVAEAAYLVLRGNLAEAISRYESLMAVLPPHQSVNWLLVRGHFARALNATGQHARASRLSRAALACSRAQDYELAVLHLDTQCQLALAEAGLGRNNRAVALVDELLGQYGQADNPLLVGLLHQTRAEVALQASDPGGFERHFAETDRLFRGSNNPALLASLDRLIDRAIRRGLRHRTTGVTQPHVEMSESSRHTVLRLQYALDEHSVAHNRHQQALRLIVEHARARGGSLFAYVAGAMQLVAGSAPGPALAELQTRLEELAVRHHFEEIDEGEDTRMVRQARIELKTLVSRRSRGQRKRNSLQTPYGMPEEEPVTAIVTQSSEMERLSSLRSSTPDAEPKSDPSDDDDDDVAIRTVFVASDRPGPDGAAQQWFLLRLPSQAPGIRDRVVGGLVLEMDPKELFRVDPEILSVIARTLSPG